MDLLIMLIMAMVMGLGYSLVLYISQYKYRAKPHRVKEKTWPEFATANNLTYTKGTNWQQSYVFGRYKGYHLELKTFGREAIAYTHMVIQADENKPQADSTSVSKLQGEAAIKKVFNLLVPYRLPSFSGRIGATAKGETIFYKERGIVTDANKLWLMANWLRELVYNYPLLLAMGGRAVPALLNFAHNENSPLKEIALRLLKDIAEISKSQYAHQTLPILCPDCLTNYQELDINIGLGFTYWACRNCLQNSEFLLGEVVAVLDSDRSTKIKVKDDLVEVNWLLHRRPFDFNRVQIVQATDEDIERFAVQIGNDTDDLRQARYKTIPCFVSAEYALSENSRRVLEQVFEIVETG